MANTKLMGLFQDPEQAAGAMTKLKEGRLPRGRTWDVYSGSPFPEGSFGEHEPEMRLFMFPLVGALVGFAIGLLWDGWKRRSPTRWSPAASRCSASRP